MAITYKKITNIMTGVADSIQKTDSDSNILSQFPLSEDNIDYRAYLEWVEEGNEAEDPDLEPFIPDIPIQKG